SLPGGRLEISPLAMMRTSNPFTRSDRNGPIFFSYPYADEDTIEIAPPKGYAAEALPAASEQKSAVGRYAVNVQNGEGGSVRIVRTFELKRYSAGPELYAAYRALFEAAARGDAGLSILFKKAPAVRKASP